MRYFLFERGSAKMHHPEHGNESPFAEIFGGGNEPIVARHRNGEIRTIEEMREYVVYPDRIADIREESGGAGAKRITLPFSETASARLSAIPTGKAPLAHITHQGNRVLIGVLDHRMEVRGDAKFAFEWSEKKTQGVAKRKLS